MPLRILLAESSRPVVAAIRRDLEERGCAVDAAAPADAAGRAIPGRYGAALVRGTGAVAEAMADLRAADPLLPIVVLFLDRQEAAAAGPLDADGVLVGPLTASAVGTVCAFAGKLREVATRAQALEARLAAVRGGQDLEFLKKLLFVEVKRSRRYGHPLSLALLSVDGWAELAPKLGVRARTALLAELLGVVSRSLRDIDFAVPFSDERIVVMMPHTGADGALRVARRLAARVRDHAGAVAVKVTASVGVASHGGDGTVSFGGLVRRAGEALERARGQGGDRAEPADPVKKRDRISIG